MADQTDVEYWRERAHEARMRAMVRRDVEGRHALLHIAENYDRLAEESAANPNVSVPEVL
ncbi:MAG TPA: hypothetical protein VGU20_03020 [Stellaceae bacterium]|nr:hypothetical protein [Stellaceae bacterium]